MTSYLPPKTPAQNPNNVSTSIQREGKLFVQLWDGTEKVQVNPDGSINTNIVDPITGEPVRVEPNGGLAVNLQDQTSRAFDLFFTQDVGSPTTLTTDTVIDSYSISCTTGHGLAATNLFVLFDPVTQHGHTAEVVSVSGANIVNMDRPTSYVLPSASTVVQERTNELIVDGSGTRQIFSVGSPLTAELDVVRIMFQMTTDDPAAWNLFGDQTALTRGLLFRQTKNVGGDVNHWNVKANSELSNLMYDVQFFNSALPIGVNGLAGRLTYGSQGKHGVVLRIGAGEQLQIIVQDDLSDIVSFHIMAQGHIVTD
jgi:hypothetical protein